MSISKKAYSSYLESKYENEIIEFKEIALKEVDNLILDNEKTILYYVLNFEGLKTEVKEIKDFISQLKEVKSKVEYDCLNLELNNYHGLGLLDCYKAYKKLEDIIVEGEKVNNEESNLKAGKLEAKKEWYYR